jgi:acetyl-CoA acetyltransferase
LRNVTITGAGITQFGKSEKSLRELAEEAIRDAVDDAGIDIKDIGFVVHGNAMAGLTTGQEMIRGQVLTADTELVGRPLVNVENACATSSSALHLAWLAVGSGQYDSALVFGTEKMTSMEKRSLLTAMTTGADIERLPDYNRELTGTDGPAESFFMEVYAQMAREYMEKSGATARDFAQVAVKNSRHGLLNPKAQYRMDRTLEEVLQSRLIADPLTMLMCSPVADGAAALVIEADDARASGADRAVRIRASALATGVPGGGENLETRTARAAYDGAGVGPDELDVVEVHDGASANELMVYEELGLCDPGEGPALLASGATELGGRVPVNPSGGLVSRGHPVGATGCAQIVELVIQLRGEAGARQVAGARIGLAENAGGYVHPDPAACVVTILSKD